MRHAMTMAFERFPMTAHGASPIRVARLTDAENQAFDLRVPAGCEVFVGRYIRVPGLYTADGIIRYREPAIG